MTEEQKIKEAQNKIKELKAEIKEIQKDIKIFEMWQENKNRFKHLF